MREWCAIALLFVACAAADAPPKPRWKQNLKVLPDDITKDDLTSTMHAYNRSLGVECEYCHVETPSGRDDFASDDKPEKRIARAMFLMTQRINADTIARVAPDKTQVTCYTCHRGTTNPEGVH